MIKVLCIFGTRPEAIKMAPVIKQLQKFPENIESVICITGQHRRMLDQILSTFNITPDIDLDLMQENQTLSSLTARAVNALEGVFDTTLPDLVLVQGDTTTAMAGALVAHYHKVPVGHIEAGLRTGERYNPFPEEINRRLISVLSSYHFAPTNSSRDYLVSEGYPEEKVLMTGNTVIDALLHIHQKNKARTVNYINEDRKTILVTAHRRENFDKPIRNICNALVQIVKENEEVEIVYPVHLNPNVQGAAYEMLSGNDRIHLIPPLDYEELIYLLSRSYLVLTDSGGIQEEAPALGKPVIVMRKTTERPEGISAGVARLVGTETGDIVNGVNTLLSDKKEYQKMSHSISPYGDGKAAKRIVDEILKIRNND